MNTIKKLIPVAVALLAAFVLNVPLRASAHEKWFTDSAQHPIQLNRAFDPVTLLSLGLGFAAVGVAYLLDRFWQSRQHPSKTAERIGMSDERLKALYNWMPLLLATHVAVPLLVNGVQFSLFAPNMQLSHDIIGALFALGEIVVALGLVYGAMTEFAALLLISLYVGGIFAFGPEALFEHFDMVGIAVFMLIVGRGPFSVDYLLGRTRAINLMMLPWAVSTLRVMLGLSILVLAFTEKLWNPDLGLAFLNGQPLNFLPYFGILNSDYTFVMCAGIVEVIFGLLLISGYLPRLVLAVAWVPFNLSLPFLGWYELVGHLPIYATMVVLFVFSPLTQQIRHRIAGRLVHLRPMPRRHSIALSTQK